MLRADMVVDSVEDLTHTWLPLFHAKTEVEKVSTKKAREIITDYYILHTATIGRKYASVASMLVPLSSHLLPCYSH